MRPRLAIRRLDSRTVPGLLRDTASRLPDKVFIHFVDPAAPTAPPREVTYSAFRTAASRVARGLSAHGLGPGHRVLLLAENSPEWQEVALGTQLLRAEPVALFASLSAEPARAIAARVSPRAVFVSGPAQWEKLAPSAGALAEAGLKLVVSGEPLPEGSAPAGVELLPLSALLGEGVPALPAAELERLTDAVGEEDPFLLLFTSGTTGRPKGVRLPQRSLVHAVEAGHGAVGTSERDLGLHFLPFAHVAGHDQFVLALSEGHALAMIARREDLDRALALSPTYLFSVPMVYDRVRLAVEAKLDGLPVPLRALARSALAAAARVRLEGSRGLADRALTRVADRLVGKAVRARLGGNVRGLFSGGAPAAPVLYRFFETLGIPFVELYGMSETGGLISSNLFDGVRREASAGLLTPDHEVRFGPDGELLLRGPLLLSGYLDAEDTLAAFDDEGYFHTGDIARLDAKGMLQVEGRKKHLLVLSTGKKLSPEPIEQAIASAAPIEGAVLLGEGKPFVSAAVFVAKVELDRLAAQGLDASEALLPRVRAALGAFSEYEKPKRLVIISGAPQDHPALITPTLKLKREAVVDSIRPRIAEVYG